VYDGDLFSIKDCGLINIEYHKCLAFDNKKIICTHVNLHEGSGKINE